MHYIYGTLLAASFASVIARRCGGSARRMRMHTVSEIEEKIRRRYHQPKGVEQFGIEPVPMELKTVRWLDIFAIIFGFALNPGSILVGGLAVVSGLSFLGCRWLHYRRRAAGYHRLHDHGHGRRRFRGAGPGLDPHGLWHPRRQVGAFAAAHARLDLLVRLPDRGRVLGGGGDPRPLDRNPAFAGRGQPDLCRAAGCGRDHRL